MKQLRILLVFIFALIGAFVFRDIKTTEEYPYIKIPKDIEEVGEFKNGTFSIKKNGKYGLMRADRTIVVEPIWDSVESFNERGYSRVGKDGKYGVINNFGNILIRPKYRGLSQINKKTYIVSTGKGEKYHILGSRNDFTEADIDLSSKYDKILSFCSHVAIVRKDGMDFILDLYSYEMKILGSNYKVVSDFINRMAVIKGRNGKYGLINEEGDIVIEPEYQYLSLEGEDMVLFREGKNYGYMDRMENIIIPAAFKEITPFYKDRAIFKINGKEGVVDITGKVIVLPEYMEVIGIRDNLYILRTEKGVGVFNEKGKAVIEPKYYGITFFGKNNFKVMDRGIVRIINYAGKEMLNVKASEITEEWKDKGQINLKDRIYLFI